MTTRSDKKFGVKLWVPAISKDLFRSRCFEYHLSMMFVGERYLTTLLDETSDEYLDYIIHARLDRFLNLKSQRDGYEILGIRLTNDYWQKLAYFAVRYGTSVAKIASCFFDYALGAQELTKVEKSHGLVFKIATKKKFQGKSIEEINERLSDYQ